MHLGAANVHSRCRTECVPPTLNLTRICKVRTTSRIQQNNDVRAEIIADLELCLFVNFVLFGEKKQKATKGMKKLARSLCELIETRRTGHRSAAFRPLQLKPFY
jgi:hypothetical protein